MFSDDWADWAVNANASMQSNKASDRDVQQNWHTVPNSCCTGTGANEVPSEMQKPFFQPFLTSLTRSPPQSFFYSMDPDVPYN